MDHPVFGRLEWREEFGWWSGRCRIDFFSAYDDVASCALARSLGSRIGNKAPDDRHTKGDFALHVINPDGESPTMQQEEAYKHFLGNQDSYCEAAAAAVVDHYRMHRDAWLRFTDERLAPELHSPDGLKTLIRLEGLHVLDASDRHPALVGFVFTCSWDIEHGLGVLLRGGAVVAVGENDITWNGLGD